MLKKYILIFLVSMVPVIELRGAIPIAVGMGLDKLPSFIIAIIGNMVPVPFIYFFARKILLWGKDKKIIGKIFTWCLGIPLPGTGAWTGTLAASILNLDFKKSVIAATFGVLLAGLIMMAISFGVFEIIF